jgi:hypothetical protein
MPPNNPCHNCKDEGLCPIAGMINRLALTEWIDDRFFECPEFRANYHHGVEGCYA